MSDVEVTIELPEGFPAKYADAVVRAAEQCTVKKHFEHPPVIRVVATGRNALANEPALARATR